MKKKPLLILFVVILLVIGLFLRKENPKPEPTSEVVTMPTHEDTVKKQFSAWDGSHRGFEKVVKKSLDDPKSFEHISTTYTDYPNQGEITVVMTYRAKNAFGGVVTNKVSARVDYHGNVLKIIN